ncbi:putative bifunctional diguanylate cyclase/phosphodiesterase [Yoonia sediminilitoris]|nr:EAL domain-containing protein [Yoonia sediminilitoris]
MAFALMLTVSTAISFIGYRYLNVASEFRERNFNHLVASQNILDVARKNPIMRSSQAAELESLLQTAQAEAVWCRDTLSPFEKRLFAWLGAGPALQICDDNILHVAAAQALIDQIIAPETISAVGPDSAFALGLRFADAAEVIIEDSEAFQPYVSIIEDRITRYVRVGTASGGIALALIFLFLARQTILSLRAQNRTKAVLIEKAAVAESVNDSIAVTGPDGVITWVNPAFERLTGSTLDEVVGKTPIELLGSDQMNPKDFDDLKEAIAARRTIRRDIPSQNKSGDDYWIRMSISPYFGIAGEYRGYISVSTDISNLVKQQQELESTKNEVEHQALHDPLTGLPNRRALDQELHRRGTDKKDSGAGATLVRIDLDQFKYVNDTLGHAAGDFVLVDVAKTLSKLSRAQDLPARIGGDEFVVLLAPGTSLQEGEEFALRALRHIQEPIDYLGKQLRVGASFGVASTLDGLLDDSTLNVGADAALYEAKESGRNQVQLYSPLLHENLQTRRSMPEGLKEALEQDDFEPHYQIQVDAQTHEVVGVEMLGRWHSPRQGVVMPDKFLPVAQRLAIVDNIDVALFKRAMRELEQLLDEGFGLHRASFNVTAARIEDVKTAQTVVENRPPGLKVAFEILESVLIEDQGDHFRFGLDALREAGVAIEIDDFGSGHASIVGLMQLRPDAMKIDRRLISSVVDDAICREVVQSIMNIAHATQLTVVAEGVETMEHADLLRDMGCHTLQGYAFSKPVPLDGLRDLLSRRAGSAMKSA